MKTPAIYSRLIYLIVIIFFGLNQASGQCIAFNGGPYTNLNTVMPGGIAPCDPNCGTVYTLTAFEVFSSESYIFYGVIQGNTYTVDICTGPGTGSWSPEITVGPFDGTTISSVDGNVSGNCTLTFTASTSGDYLIVLNTAAVCGGLENGINGGFLSVQCNGSASCTPPTCGISPFICDPAEDYCLCSVDCPCPTIVVNFIDYTTGTPAIATGPGFAYCADETFVPVGSNPIPEKIYVPLGITTSLTCVSAFDVSVDDGLLSQSDGTSLIPITTTEDFIVFWLELTDADLTATGGISTITISDATNGPGLCSSTFDIDIGLLTNFTTDVASTCPGLCGPAEGTATYDCTTNSVIVDITDVGTPTAPNSFDISLDGVPSVPSQTVTGPTSYTLGSGLAEDSTFTIIISDGLTDGCNLTLTDIYPDCYSSILGCNDVVLEGDLESATNWTQSSVDNTSTATGIDVITTTFPLQGTQHAWLGGYGGSAIGSGPPYTTNISQSMSFTEGGTITMYYWLLLGACDSANDELNIIVDGTPIASATITAGDSQCLTGTWTRRMVDLSAFADGDPHVIAFQSTETETNGSNTNFFVDEIIIEDCNLGDCPPNFAGVNALSGPETGVVDYETNGVIESSQQILSGAQVDYDSNFEINLNNDFEVDANADFHGFIDGCLGALINGEGELMKRLEEMENAGYDFKDVEKILGIDKSILLQPKLKDKTLRNIR